MKNSGRSCWNFLLGVSEVDRKEGSYEGNFITSARELLSAQELTGY